MDKGVHETAATTQSEKDVDIFLSKLFLFLPFHLPNFLSISLMYAGTLLSPYGKRSFINLIIIIIVIIIMYIHLDKLTHIT